MIERERKGERQWRRFAYVAVMDAACRAEIVRVLNSAGWRVEERASGYHVLQDLCDIIACEQGRIAPGLIVIDARARSCDDDDASPLPANRGQDCG